MWEQYYPLRLSSKFIENWTRFLQLSEAEATPTLYQHIFTDIICNFRTFYIIGTNTSYHCHFYTNIRKFISNAFKCIAHTLNAKVSICRRA